MNKVITYSDSANHNSCKYVGYSMLEDCLFLADVITTLSEKNWNDPLGHSSASPGYSSALLGYSSASLGYSSASHGYSSNLKKQSCNSKEYSFIFREHSSSPAKDSSFMIITSRGWDYAISINAKFYS